MTTANEPARAQTAHQSTTLTETIRTKAPKLVLSRDLGEMALAIESHFRALGWCVKIAEDAANARKLASKAQAVVLLSLALPESGFLSCAKLKTANPHARIVLVGPESESMERYARYVGATGYVSEATPIAEVIDLIVDG